MCINFSRVGTITDNYS